MRAGGGACSGFGGAVFRPTAGDKGFEVFAGTQGEGLTGGDEGCVSFRLLAAGEFFVMTVRAYEPALFEGELDRVHRAADDSRFDDDDAGGQAALQAVSLHEVGFVRVFPRRVFRQEAASFFQDFFGQSFVGFRVDGVQAFRHDRRRLAAVFQAAFVAGGVAACRQAAYYGDAGVRQHFPYAFTDLVPVLGGGSGADDGDAGLTGESE